MKGAPYSHRLRTCKPCATPSKTCARHVLLTSTPWSSCPTLCTASGHCPQATLIFRPAEGLSKPGSPNIAILACALCLARPVRPGTRRRCGSSAIGNTNCAMPLASPTMPIASAATRSGTDWPRPRQIGRIPAFGATSRQAFIPSTGARVLWICTGKVLGMSEKTRQVALRGSATGIP